MRVCIHYHLLNIYYTFRSRLARGSSFPLLPQQLQYLLFVSNFVSGSHPFPLTGCCAKSEAASRPPMPENLDSAGGARFKVAICVSFGVSKFGSHRVVSLMCS